MIIVNDNNHNKNVLNNLNNSYNHNINNNNHNTNNYHNNNYNHNNNYYAVHVSRTTRVLQYFVQLMSWLLNAYALTSNNKKTVFCFFLVIFSIK